MERFLLLAFTHLASSLLLTVFAGCLLRPTLFPIDYGPVVLLMPFGFHLAMDTLPSGARQAVAWLYPAFAFVLV